MDPFKIVSLKQEILALENLQPNYYFDLSSFEHREIFDDINHVWEVLPKISVYLRSFKLGNIGIDIPKTVYLINPEFISIGEGTVVEPGSYIKGPCIIGKNCTIRHGAYIRGDLITGDNCVIGHDTEVKNALFLNDAHAAHFAYVGDSILGNRVNLGAGTICANLKLDRSPVKVPVDGKHYNTQLKKFGAVIGDDSQTGCNSVTNPGTLLGKSVYCYPCTNLGGFIPSDHVVKFEQNLKLRKGIK
jgi:NDP-sugar pyrophosphorylase family protein